MRNSSCRQLVGLGNAALYNHKPELGSWKLGNGNIARSGTAWGSIGTRAGLAPLPNCTPVAGLIGQSANFPFISGQSSLKSPKAPCDPVQPTPPLPGTKPRSKQEGTTALKTCPGTRSRRHSSEKKKKVLVLS